MRGGRRARRRAKSLSAEDFSERHPPAELGPFDPSTYTHIVELGTDFGDQQTVGEAYWALRNIDPDLAQEAKNVLTS